MSNIVPLTSLYVPLGCPQSKFPGYINLDPALQWYKSALLSVAVETCTLPTRLRDSFGAGRLGKLDDLASFLNANGGQKIASLSMTVHNPNPSTSGLCRLSASDEEFGLSWNLGGYEFSGIAKRPQSVQGHEGHVFARAEVVRVPDDDRARVVATADASKLPSGHNDAVFERWVRIFYSFPPRFLSPCPACCGFREGRRTLYPLYTLGQLSYLTDSGAPRIESHDYQRPIARLFTA